MIRMMCGVRLVDRVWTDDRCGGMVMSCMEISIPKYVRLWKLKQLGKGKRVTHRSNQRPPHPIAPPLLLKDGGGGGGRVDGLSQN